LISFCAGRAYFQVTLSKRVVSVVAMASQVMVELLDGARYFQVTLSNVVVFFQVTLSKV